MCVCVYLRAVYSISSIHIKKTKQHRALGYIIVVLIALKIE